ncbi:MAG: hypothetical protein ACYSW3_28775 [Planctomycetota bacterium]
MSDFYGAGQEFFHEQTFVPDAGEPPIPAGGKRDWGRGGRNGG